MPEMSLTQLAREASPRERELHRVALWAEDGQAALRRALLKRTEKEPLNRHLDLVIGHLRVAQQELAALAKELPPVLSGGKR